MNTIKHLPIHDYSGHEAETASGLHNVQAVDSDQRERRHRAAARGIAGCLILIMAVAVALFWALTAHAQLQPGPFTGGYTGTRYPLYPATYAPTNPADAADLGILANVARVNTNSAPVPEPADWALLSLGVFVLVVWHRRHRRRNDLRRTIEQFGQGPAPVPEQLSPKEADYLDEDICPDCGHMTLEPQIMPMDEPAVKLKCSCCHANFRTLPNVKGSFGKYRLSF